MPTPSPSPAPVRRADASRRRPAAAALAIVLVAALAFVATGQETPPPADDAPVLVVTGQHRQAVRIAFPRVDVEAGLTGDVLDAAQEIEQTLRADLEYSPAFNVQGPTELSVLVLTGADENDFEQYRSLGNDVLLRAEIAREGDRMVLVGRVYDLASRQPIDGKRYRGPIDQSRRIAHSFADWLHHLFTGRPGIALTSIAFHSNRDGFQELYLMDYDGRGQRRVTAHRSTSGYPDWHPSGESLAYVSYYTGSAGIHQVDLGSGEKRAIFTEEVLSLSPSHSPDGRRIAFSHSDGSGDFDVFVCDLPCRSPRKITDSRAIDTNPAWSPSGNEIAFTSDRSGRPNIYVMNTDGGNVRRVSFEGDYNDGASWRPDGTHLAYATRRDSRSFDIAVTSLVDLETRVVISGNDSYEEPSWSPDGHRIAFTRKRGRDSQIFVADADGGNLRQLTVEGASGSPSWQRQPAD